MENTTNPLTSRNFWPHRTIRQAIFSNTGQNMRTHRDRTEKDMIYSNGDGKSGENNPG